MKICKDCKWYVYFEDCTHQSNGCNLIDGKPKRKSTLVQRSQLGRCKPEGLLFEAKEVTIRLPSLYSKIIKWFKGE